MIMNMIFRKKSIRKINVITIYVNVIIINFVVRFYICKNSNNKNIAMKNDKI